MPALAALLAALACAAPPVHPAPYPAHAAGLGGLPWVRGKPAILWVFLSPHAKHSYSGGDLVVQGRRLDGPGTTRQRFASVGYQGQNGAPSFASIIDLPTAGCWQLRLSADGLRATIDFLAVPD